ncbi:MAG: hypothetical protein FWE61_08905 [Micrococcales bacterium]|nr:hypothetical protein [Micrococcales bacterium]
MLAGSADTLVPATQSATVASLAPTLHRHTVLDGIGHNDPVWFGPYLAAVADNGDGS